MTDLQSLTRSRTVSDLVERARQTAAEAMQRLTEGVNDKRPMDARVAFQVAAQHAGAVAAFVPPLAEHVTELADALERAERERDEAREALSFYADPESYFAIGILPDRPAGLFADDFGNFSPNWSDDMSGPRPGDFARRVLGDVTPEQVDAWRNNRESHVLSQAQGEDATGPECSE